MGRDGEVAVEAVRRRATTMTIVFFAGMIET